MDASLDMDSFNKMLGKLGEVSNTPLPESREASKLTGLALVMPSVSRMGTFANTPNKKVSKEVRTFYK